MLVIGFLTGAASAEPVEAALDCISAMEREQLAHAEKVIEAESIGLRIDHLRRAGSAVPEELLRRAERLEQEALDREVELASRRELCRSLSLAALEQCRGRIKALQSSLSAGELTSEDAEELLGLYETRSRLEAVLEAPITLSYALLPLDPSDTQETLRAKLQYYEDVHEYLEGLLARITARTGDVARERQTLVEAQRFLDDMSFLDEGGRMSAGGPLRLPGGGESDVPGHARPALRSGELGLASRELESLMSLSPASPGESDQLLDLLSQVLIRIESEVEAVSRERDRIEERLLSDTTDPR